MRDPGQEVVVRPTRFEDRNQIVALCERVYPFSPPWSTAQLASHLEVFPEGQFVAEELHTGRILGMASSLVIRWDDYDFQENWRDFTDHGMFTNHDIERGRTLYGAEIMVDPATRGLGIGSRIYRARRELARRLKLLRIRAGARLRGYSRHSSEMTPDEYVFRVIRGELRDPTLSFQIKHGFHVLAVVHDYLRKDPESLGNAAVIEWINREVAGPADQVARDSDFERELQAFYRKHPEVASGD